MRDGLISPYFSRTPIFARNSPLSRGFVTLVTHPLGNTTLEDTTALCFSQHMYIFFVRSVRNKRTKAEFDSHIVIFLI